MWSRALTHAVQLIQLNVEAHEVLQRVLGDGRSACETAPTAVQPKGTTHSLEDQIISQHEAPGHRGITGKQSTGAFSHLDSNVNTMTYFYDYVYYDYYYYYY